MFYKHLVFAFIMSQHYFCRNIISMKDLFKTSNWIYIIIVLACFHPLVSPAMALITGMVLSVIGLKPQGKQFTSRLLQISVVLLGFGMNLNDVITASKSGFIITLISVSSVMLCGLLLGKLFKTEKNITILISAGTAICGGSAIAAIAPVLNSKSYQNSVALVVVFLLNAIALLLFPIIGQHLGLSQDMFGNWAAIAIHDTSAVVGAAETYGPKALQVATTVKLIRALWIIPLSIAVVLLNKKGNFRSIQFPWFILLFVAAIIVSNWVPALHTSYEYLNWLGKRGMVITLLIIGLNISIAEIKQSGFKSFALGVTLWIVTGTVSLLMLWNLS